MGRDQIRGALEIQRPWDGKHQSCSREEAQYITKITGEKVELNSIKWGKPNNKPSQKMGIYKII